MKRVAQRLRDVAELRLVASAAADEDGGDTAPVRLAAARKRKAARVPPDEPSTGRTAAPSAPPIGIAVWRIPSASPSSVEGNQAMIARPLAALTLAPSAPTPTSTPVTAPNVCVVEATTSRAAAPVSPVAITQRSSTRSATSPHGSSVKSIPIPIAASTTPVSARLSPYSDFSVGLSAGSPTEEAEKLACASVPAASTTQRYR